MNKIASKAFIPGTTISLLAFAPSAQADRGGRWDNDVGDSVRHVGRSANRATFVIESFRWVADRHNGNKERERKEREDRELRGEVECLQRLQNERDWRDTVRFCRQCSPNNE